MSESVNKEINRLELENLLWLLFIVASILNIFADKMQEEYLKTNDPRKEEQAKEIYIFVLVLTMILYLYFANRNYNFLKEAQRNNQDTNLLMLRFIGSVFLIIGVSLILYYQVNSKNSSGSPAI